MATNGRADPGRTLSRFPSLGHAVCDNDELEPGFEKTALFALGGVPKQAARQLTPGRWVSKLGQAVDIEHGLHDLTDMLYGAVALIMSRPIRVAPRQG